MDKSEGITIRSRSGQGRVIGVKKNKQAQKDKRTQKEKGVRKDDEAD